MMRYYKIGFNFMIMVMLSLWLFGCVSDYGHNNTCPASSGHNTDENKSGTLTLRLRADQALSSKSDGDAAVQQNLRYFEIFIVDRNSGKIEFARAFDINGSRFPVFSDGSGMHHDQLGHRIITYIVKNLKPGIKTVYAYAVGESVKRGHHSVIPENFVSSSPLFNWVLTPHDKDGSAIVFPDKYKKEKLMKEADLTQYYLMTPQQNFYGFANVVDNWLKPNDPSYPNYLHNIVSAGRVEEVPVYANRSNTCELPLYCQMAGVRVWLYADQSFDRTKVSSFQISMTYVPVASPIVFMKDENDLSYFKKYGSPSQLEKRDPELFSRLKNSYKKPYMYKLPEGGIPGSQLTFNDNQVILNSEALNRVVDSSYQPFYTSKGMVYDCSDTPSEIYPITVGANVVDPPLASYPDVKGEPFSDSYDKGNGIEEHTTISAFFPQFTLVFPPVFPKDWSLGADHKPEIVVKLTMKDGRIMTYKFAMIGANADSEDLLPNHRYNMRIILSQVSANIYYHVDEFVEKSVDVPAFE